MNWTNVRLILAREVRDQLRDRRTLFMIVVLPVLLYPLLGMSIFQVTQLLREHAVRVLVVGAPTDPDMPSLVDSGQFAARLFGSEQQQALLQLTLRPNATNAQQADLVAAARDEMREGNFDVVLYFPPGFAEAYRSFRAALVDSGDERSLPAGLLIPNIDVYPNLAKDSSQVAYRRVMDVLARWRDEIGRKNLQESHVAPAAARPFDIATLDVAEPEQHKAALWSKILPFVLLIWALTGAFYPAVDLCAGEKERGTLETLLSSPAERIEIVWGKLLTVMLFSAATSLLNITSLVATGALALRGIPNFGAPPIDALCWLLVALVPMSALFAALSLALAAFARSTKEGQYYLMPLVLVIMPLVILPLAPGVELSLGYALIPITGMMLLLRTVLEGNYVAAIPFVLPVLAVTLGCLWLAVRWATNQFNSESVLFRESERLNLGLWLRHQLRDRAATPSFGQALFCAVIILLLKFVFSFTFSAPQSSSDFTLLVIVTALGVIAAPTLLLTLLLTRSPRQTLLLRPAPAWTTLAAVVLAVVLQPAANGLQALVGRIYPLDATLAAQLNQLLGEPPSLWAMLVTFAVLPAVCEELAFRGFILSGLRHSGSKWTAIVLSSIVFGASHALLQQSLIACVLGVVIGFLAVQSGSLLPCVLFHCTHNGLALVIHRMLPDLTSEGHPLSQLFRKPSDDGLLYTWPAVVCSIVAGAAILAWFGRLPYRRTAEEVAHEATCIDAAGFLSR